MKALKENPLALKSGDEITKRQYKDGYERMKKEITKLTKEIVAYRKACGKALDETFVFLNSDKLKIDYVREILRNVLDEGTPYV